MDDLKRRININSDRYLALTTSLNTTTWITKFLEKLWEDPMKCPKYQSRDWFEKCRYHNYVVLKKRIDAEFQEAAARTQQHEESKQKAKEERVKKEQALDDFFATHPHLRMTLAFTELERRLISVILCKKGTEQKTYNDISRKQVHPRWMKAARDDLESIKLRSDQYSFSEFPDPQKTFKAYAQKIKVREKASKTSRSSTSRWRSRSTSRSSSGGRKGKGKGKGKSRSRSKTPTRSPSAKPGAKERRPRSILKKRSPSLHPKAKKVRLIGTPGSSSTQGSSTRRKRSPSTSLHGPRKGRRK